MPVLAVPSARLIAVPSVFTNFTDPSVPSCFRLTPYPFINQLSEHSGTVMLNETNSGH